MISTDLTTRPKNQWKQSTRKWRRSTQDLVGRSTVVWQNSKYHYHQSTMEIWHKSTDTWTSSKDRCQQSAKSALGRTVWRWNQTADQVHRAARIEGLNKDATDQPQQTVSSSSPPSPQSRFYSRVRNSSDSTKPSSNTKAPTANVTRPSLSPEQQIKGFYEATILVRSLVAQTKQVRDKKSEHLGDIELEWINSNISDAEKTINDLFAFVEPFWINQCKTTGDISHSCNAWSHHDYQRARKKESRMLLSHSKVQTVFGHLDSVQMTLGPEDESCFTAPVVSELSSETHVVSVFELPSSSATKIELSAELPSSYLAKAELPVPKIIVTQYDGDQVDSVSSHSGSPPPSYEASGMKSAEEMRWLHP